MSPRDGHPSGVFREPEDLYAPDRADKPRMWYALRRSRVLAFLALAVLAPIVLCAFQVSSLLEESLHREARDNSVQDARLIADQGLAAALADGRLTTADRAAAAAEFSAARRSHPLIGLAVWSPEGGTLMSAGSDAPRSPRGLPAPVRKAFATGLTQSASASNSSDAGGALHVAVPVRARRNRYVAEFVFSAAGVRHIVAAADRRLYTLVAIAALLFYAATLPMLARLVRRLPSPPDPAVARMLPELRRGIPNEELRVHYQPKVDVASGQVVGVEALARWQHPERGLLSPGAFIPAAESDPQLLSDLTAKILDLAIRDCAHWRRSGRRLPVAVNVSAQMLFDGRLPTMVSTTLERHDLEAQLLTLEITESAVMQRGADAVAALSKLRELGARVSIDDFGTGYSSLSRLRALPLDEIKVDRSFVAGVASDERDLALVRMMVDLASNFGLDLVAEGVEDAPTLAMLESLGCRVAQGFLFSRPLPESELVDCVERNSSAPPREVAVLVA